MLCGFEHIIIHNAFFKLLSISLLYKTKNMKQKSRTVIIFSSIIVFLFLQLTVSAQQAKVVGYLPSYRFSSNSSIEYCKLTHLNVCFANPDSNGSLKIDNFTTVVNTAREVNPNIIICVSLGGAGLTESEKQNWSHLIDNAANRPGFISKIISFVKNSNLDGVDVDLEWSDVTSGYSNFVISLSDSLHSAGKIMTSALPGTYRYEQITDEVLEANDFINIMAYDETGPWNPNKPGQHSSYDFAVRSLNFWKNQHVSSDKLVLGVPFYGYNFDENNIGAFTYSEMVLLDVKYADTDSVDLAYYNGRPTIRKKVILASQNAAGIMIWEVAQDSFDEYSLLKTIHEKFTSLGYTTTGLCGNVTTITNVNKLQLSIYPNPASSVAYVEYPTSKSCKIDMFDISGKKIYVPLDYLNEKARINVSSIKSGVYIVRIIGDDFSKSIKLEIQSTR